MITHSYNYEGRYIEVRWSGTVDLDDIIRYFEEIRDADYPDKHVRLIDARNVKLYIDPKELHKIDVARKLILDDSGSFKTAIITNTLIETALSYLYADYSNNADYNFSIFSTKRLAKNWITNLRNYI
jgi:hypothetical protein